MSCDCRHPTSFSSRRTTQATAPLSPVHDRISPGRNCVPAAGSKDYPDKRKCVSTATLLARIDPLHSGFLDRHSLYWIRLGSKPALLLHRWTAMYIGTPVEAIITSSSALHTLKVLYSPTSFSALRCRRSRTASWPTGRADAIRSPCPPQHPRLARRRSLLLCDEL